MTQTDWSFSDIGPEFDAHVARHLPGYFDVQRLVGLIAQATIPVGGVVADLGCSTGTTIATVDEATRGRGTVFFGYDNDASMIDEASGRLPHGPSVLINTELPDGMIHERAELTTCLWLLQFLPFGAQHAVLAAARDRAAPSGRLIVAAKTRHVDVRWQNIAVNALEDYKSAVGVSAQERADKTRALRGVLHEQTAGDYAELIHRAGWTAPTILWRWHVWTVFGAHASEAVDAVL